MGPAEVECVRPGCRTFTGGARLLLLLRGKSRAEGRPCLGDPGHNCRRGNPQGAPSSNTPPPKFSSFRGMNGAAALPEQLLRRKGQSRHGRNEEPYRKPSVGREAPKLFPGMKRGWLVGTVLAEMGFVRSARESGRPQRGCLTQTQFGNHPTWKGDHGKKAFSLHLTPGLMPL